MIAHLGALGYRAVTSGTVERGIAFCGSGIGASDCANKIPGIRATGILRLGAKIERSQTRRRWTKWWISACLDAAFCRGDK
jgi:hypothetical protein